MSTFLARYHDPAIELPPAASIEDLVAYEARRIGRHLAVCIIAGGIPRRLGGEATDDELALDRLRARRVGHALNKSIQAWTKKPIEFIPRNDSDVRAEGSVLIWTRFKSEHLVEVQARLKFVATFAINRGQERVGKSFVVRLENEMNWVDYALRD